MKNKRAIISVESVLCICVAGVVIAACVVEQSGLPLFFVFFIVLALLL